MSDPRYYAAIETESVLFGGTVQRSISAGEPHSTYDGATAEHARTLASMPWIHQPRPLVLLDLASLSDLDEQGWRRLLMTDPVLRAVYEHGRQSTSVVEGIVS